MLIVDRPTYVIRLNVWAGEAGQAGQAGGEAGSGEAGSGEADTVETLSTRMQIPTTLA